MVFNEAIIPYEGLESIHFYQSLKEVEGLLTKAKISFSKEIWKGEYETNPNPWTVISVPNILSLFFARNNKLFKITCWSDYSGALPNGIHAGMAISTALRTDPSLQFDDWNEDYESSSGYWLEDDVETKKVLSISVFIKEALDEEAFDNCAW